MQFVVKTQASFENCCWPCLMLRASMVFDYNFSAMPHINIVSEYMKHIFELQVDDQTEERLSQLFTQLLKTVGKRLND